MFQWTNYSISHFKYGLFLFCLFSSFFFINLVTLKYNLIKLIISLLNDNGRRTVNFHVDHFKIRINYPSIILNKNCFYFDHPKFFRINTPLIFYYHLTMKWVISSNLLLIPIFNFTSTCKEKLRESIAQ